MSNPTIDAPVFEHLRDVQAVQHLADIFISQLESGELYMVYNCRIGLGAKRQMFVVTFYSYKGGVGRTSALTNVAFRLASRGKKVFILDFDLEAPGIDAYPLCDHKEPHDGIVEYISVFMETGEVPPLTNYVQEATIPNLIGKLLFMPAGRKDQNYQSELSRLDWKVFYRQKKGYLFVENLKATIKETFSPDYVLIDSRTGLTDISGICTQQLPNLVVLFFSLNEQNVNGIAQIYRSIKGNKLNRSISTLLVASPVPDMPEWVTVRSQRFEYARKMIGATVDLVVPYDPFLAFQESLVDPQEDEETKTYLNKTYDSLTDKIIFANTSDVLTLLREATELRDEGNFELAELHYREVVEARPDSAEAWIEFGKFVRLRDRSIEACAYFEKALSLRPEDTEILGQLTTTCIHVDKAKAALYFHDFVEQEHDVTRLDRISTIVRDSGLLELSLRGFERMVELDSSRLESYIDLGETQMRLRHFREAAHTYISALAVESGSLVCLYNAGYALSRLGDPQAVRYFHQAIELWEQTDKTEYSPPLMANAYAAMSNAYLGIGKTDKAVRALEESLTIASTLERTRIFSVLKYINIPQPKFIAEVQQLLQNAKAKLQKTLPGLDE